MSKLVSPFDLDLLRLVHLDAAPSWVVGLFVALTVAGSGWGLLALLPLLASARSRRFGVAVLLTTGIAAGFVAGVKPIVARVRPCNALGWCHVVAVSAPTDYSFPSGHAAGSFALAGLVLGLDRRLGWLAISFATLVSISRVALGVHYPTDVIAGAAIGVVWGLWVSRRFHRRPTPGEAVPLSSQTRSSGAS